MVPNNPFKKTMTIKFCALVGKYTVSSEFAASLENNKSDLLVIMCNYVN